MIIQYDHTISDYSFSNNQVVTFEIKELNTFRKKFNKKIKDKNKSIESIIEESGGVIFSNVHGVISLDLNYEGLISLSNYKETKTEMISLRVEDYSDMNGYENEYILSDLTIKLKKEDILSLITEYNKELESKKKAIENLSEERRNKCLESNRQKHKKVMNQIKSLKGKVKKDKNKHLKEINDKVDGVFKEEFDSISNKLAEKIREFDFYRKTPLLNILLTKYNLKIEDIEIIEVFNEEMNI